MNEAAPPPQAASDATPRKARGRVLVMDDETPNRAILRKLLSAQGYDVVEAPDGAVGIELASWYAPDLALVDVMMPGLSGYEVCDLLRKNPRTSMIPVILVTARREVEDVERGFDLGAFDYIRKPFNSRELLARVRNALALKRGSDEMRLWREKMTRELELAGSLQRKLFPAHPLFVGDFAIDVAYQPSLTVGGDVFDIIGLPDRWLCVYVGDVCGHGVASALVSALLKAVVAEVVMECFREGPAAVCRAVDARFRRQVANPAIYATLFMAIFDPVRSVWTCMSCGHPDPFLIVNGGEDVSPSLAGGGDLPIGFASPKPALYAASGETQAPAPPGSTLVLLTDGLLEAMHGTSGEPCGSERVRETVLGVLRGRRHINMSRQVLDALRQAGYELNRDDCSLLFVERQHAAALRLDLELPPHIQAVATAAAQAQEVLLSQGWTEDEAMAVRLAAMEHGTNVLRHGHAAPASTIRMQLWLMKDLCRVLFRDRGREWDFAASLAAFREGPDDRESKRGLALIQALATDTDFFRQDDENFACLAFVRGSGNMSGRKEEREAS